MQQQPSEYIKFLANIVPGSEVQLTIPEPSKGFPAWPNRDASRCRLRLSATETEIALPFVAPNSDSYDSERNVIYRCLEFMFNFINAFLMIWKGLRLRIIAVRSVSNRPMPAMTRDLNALEISQVYTRFMDTYSVSRYDRFCKIRTITFRAERAI